MDGAKALANAAAVGCVGGWGSGAGNVNAHVDEKRNGRSRGSVGDSGNGNGGISNDDGDGGSGGSGSGPSPRVLRRWARVLLRAAAAAAPAVSFGTALALMVRLSLLLELYRHTNDSLHYETARRFNGYVFTAPLSQGKDDLAEQSGALVRQARVEPRARQRRVVEPFDEAYLEDRARVQEVRHDVPRKGDQHPDAHHVRAVLPLRKVQLEGE